MSLADAEQGLAEVLEMPMPVMWSMTAVTVRWSSCWKVVRTFSVRHSSTHSPER